MSSYWTHYGRRNLHPIFSFDLCPRWSCCWVSTDELVHVLFWNTVKIHSIPIPCHDIYDIFCVMLRLAAIVVRIQRNVIATPQYTHIVQAFSFALINSENVRTGIPASVVTVV